MVNISVIDNHSLITPSNKRVTEKIILSIARKVENESKYSLEFLIVVNCNLLQLGIITIWVFVTYRQT